MLTKSMKACTDIAIYRADLEQIKAAYNAGAMQGIACMPHTSHDVAIAIDRS